MTKHRRPISASRRRRGTLAIAVVAAIVVIAGIAFGLTIVTNGTAKERRAAVAQTRLQYAAEGIVEEGLARLRASGLDALRTQTGFPRTVSDVSLTLSATYGDTSASIADDLIRLVGVASQDGARAAVETYVRATRVVDPALLAFGDLSVVLDSNSSIDAYDSSLGTWASQATDTRNSIPYSDAGASLGSNGTISVGGNGQLFGDARSGPGYSPSFTGNGYLSGSRSSAPSAVVLPPVVVPAVASNGARTISTNTTIAAGSYHWTSLSLVSNAQVTVRGPSTIVIDSWLVDSNSRMTFDTSGGPINVYATGSVRFLSNAVVKPASGRPRDLKIQASGVNASIVMDSNVAFTGQLYAPVSNVELLSNAHIWGSVVARRLDLDSNGLISTDLDLLSASGGAAYTFTRLAWRSGPTLQ